MTIQVTKEEAVQKIEELLDRAFGGDEVVITEPGKRPVRLQPQAGAKTAAGELPDNPPYIVNGRRAGL